MDSSPERAADRPRPNGGAALVVGEHHGKLTVTGDIGEKLDDQLEQAKAEASRLHGKATGAAESAKLVSALSDHVRKAHEEDELTTDERELVLKWLRRAATCCSSLAGQAKSEELVANGKVAAFRQSVQTVQRFHTSARSRLDQLLSGDTDAPDAQPSEAGDPELTRSGRVSVAARRADPEAATRPTAKKTSKRAAKKTGAKKASKRAAKKTTAKKPARKRGAKG